MNAEDRLVPEAVAAAAAWVDAAGDYICIHTDGETYVLRATLGQLEKRLDPTHFPRIHRSALIACVYRAEWRHKEVERAAYRLLQHLDTKAG